MSGMAPLTAGQPVRSGGVFTLNYGPSSPSQRAAFEATVRRLMRPQLDQVTPVVGQEKAAAEGKSVAAGREVRHDADAEQPPR
jgi:hypothetical protein